MVTAVASGVSVAGFRIEKPIGEGSTGTVYLAQAPDGRRVALKLLSPELARDERFRRRFLLESTIAASLDEPHIVRTVASGEADGRLYLAMEYVDGTDLRQLLRRDGALEATDAIGVVAQVAAALDAAHAAGLVHRDVKPGNILVRVSATGPEACICDFGLARHVSSVSSLTGDRGFVGTIDYVPPEQIAGGTLDARADVYALGCVLFECLTGERPFPRDSELSVVFAHLNEPPPRACELRPELPPALDDVLRTALAKKPEDRYARCGELAHAARSALQGTAPQRIRLSRRRVLVAGAAVVAAVAAAVAGFRLTGSGSARHDAAIAPAKISERAINGITLGHRPRDYVRVLGGYKPSTLGGTHYPAMSFQQPQLAVYFPAKGRPAHIITTWNRDFRTARGIGPCSTIAAMKRAYGNRAHTNFSGTSPNGKVHWSWQLGRNLLFMTQNHKTISSVVLFDGVPVEKHGGSPRDYANYVGAVETACE